MNRLQMPFFALALAGAIVGCQTTGGTIGGLFPAPKFLKGEIKNNIYTDKDKLFSVSVPHKEGSDEYTYMRITERSYDDDHLRGSYVSFGPAAFDRNIYRVEVAKWGTPGGRSISFDEATEKVIAYYKTQIENGYDSGLKELRSGRERINGRNAQYKSFSQLVPPGKYDDKKQTTLNHEVYVIEFEQSVAIVWVQGEHGGALSARSFAETVKVL